jgi:hypothetical protein
MKQRQKILLFLISIVLLGCNGDYSKDLGGGYTLEKTNSCCIFIFSRDTQPVKVEDTILHDNRVVKPQVKKLYIDKEKIVGYKVNNQCCYLTEYEKKHQIKNGYFIIYKKTGLIYVGLDEKNLIKLNISISKMKKII